MMYAQHRLMIHSAPFGARVFHPRQVFVVFTCRRQIFSRMFSVRAAWSVAWECLLVATTVLPFPPSSLTPRCFYALTSPTLPFQSGAVCSVLLRMQGVQFGANPTLRLTSTSSPMAACLQKLAFCLSAPHVCRLPPLCQHASLTLTKLAPASPFIWVCLNQRRFPLGTPRLWLCVLLPTPFVM